MKNAEPTCDFSTDLKLCLTPIKGCVVSATKREGMRKAEFQERAPDDVLFPGIGVSCLLETTSAEEDDVMRRTTLDVFRETAAIGVGNDRVAMKSFERTTHDTPVRRKEYIENNNNNNYKKQRRCTCFPSCLDNMDQCFSRDPWE